MLVVSFGNLGLGEQIWAGVEIWVGRDLGWKRETQIKHLKHLSDVSQVFIGQSQINAEAQVYKYNIYTSHPLCRLKLITLYIASETQTLAVKSHFVIWACT